MAGHRIFSLPFQDLYPLYVTKIERKGRNTDELDEVIRWITGYTDEQLLAIRQTPEVTLERFFAEAPKLNENRSLITGVICGVRIEEIEDPLMREIRYLDKVVDELAKGRAMSKILRS